MISEETWEKFRNGKVALRCPTIDIWKLLVEYTGEEYTDIHQKNWGQYKWETCVYMSGDSSCYSSRESVLMEVVDLTEDDFREPPSSTEFPQPPQELVNILRAIANHKSIERTYGVQLELDSLYSKRDEYLAKWTSAFEVYL